MNWRIPIAKPDLPPFEEYASALYPVWNSRMLSDFGPNVEALEKLATDLLGVPCLAVSSGDVGLICAIAALQLPPGSRVLVPSFTFQSTVNAILWNGCVPVFVDIDGETLCAAPLDIARAHYVDLFAEHQNAAAVVVTDVFGAMASRPALMSRSEAIDAPFVFDSAQSFGAFSGSGPAGWDGAATVFSLSGTKVVTSAEGGLVASHDGALLERVRAIRGYGFVGDYDARFVGINGKMSELHAALGLLTMPKLLDNLARRAAIASSYQRLLDGLPLRFQRIDCTRSAWKDVAVVFDTAWARQAAQAFLTTAGIQTKRYFRPLHTQPAYRRFATRAMPVTEDVYSRILCLPVFGSMTDAEVDEVCDVVRKAVRA